MNFLKQTKEKKLILVDEELKEKILEGLLDEEELINMKIMTKSEFLKHYFYDYDAEALYYIVKNYKTNVKNARIYLDNIKYVLDYESEEPRILFLKKMYQDLKDHNLLIIDEFFKSYLKSLSIIVLFNKQIEPFYQKILSNYKVQYENIMQENKLLQPKLYHFKDINLECEFIFNQISSLIKKGINISNIKIISLGQEYEHFLLRFSKFYKIKLNNLERYSIYGVPATSKVLAMIDEGKTKEKILAYLNKNIQKDIYQTIFNVLNRYYFVSDFREVKELIIEDFKNTYLKLPKWHEAVELLPLNSFLVTDKDYVFVMGFNLENIPKTYKDIDYLDDKLKQELGLFTSLEKNIISRDQSLYYLQNIKNLTITYKTFDPYASFFPSNLLNDLNITPEEVTTSLNETSNLYNKVKLTMNLDEFLKYGSENQETAKLFNTYKNIKYLTYDNKFKGLKAKFSNLKLSYTSIDSFYHCRFRFYIDNILKLNIYEDNFKIYIGNLFHYVLSKMYQEDFDLEREYQEFIKDKTFTPKEKFYLEILKEELKDIVSILREHYNLTGLTKIKTEEEIKLPFDDNTFKGIIDKIMYKEKDDVTYLSLIDYKTGFPKTNMTNLIHGIDMQLPIYAYLVKKSNLFLNPKIVGFYFEQIIHEPLSYTLDKTYQDLKKDSLKLQGYTIDEVYPLEMFDPTYQNSEMIKSMKITSKGFAHYTKVLSSKAIDSLVSIVDLKIKEAFKAISEGDFTINPKIIEKDNIGCKYCKYQDLCFKTGNDDCYLPKQDDLSYLEGGDNNA